jgi:uncharacterized protein
VVTPRSSRDQLLSWDGECLRVRLRAPPVDGAANEALVGLLAKSLDLPKASIFVKAGHTSRRKTVVFSGLSTDQLASALRRIASR